MSFFVTGTDTGVGKTETIARILKRYRSLGLQAAGMKPICCGDRGDATKLVAASSCGLSIDQINPIWLRMPAAPLVASRVESRTLQMEEILDAFEQLQLRVPNLFVEGVGGWEVPAAADWRMSDLAKALDLPVLLVVHNRLGCINHTLLTLQAIEADGLECRGIVLNQFGGGDEVATKTNREVLQEVTKCGVLVPLTDQGGTFTAPWRQILGL